MYVCVCVRARVCVCVCVCVYACQRQRVQLEGGTEKMGVSAQSDRRTCMHTRTQAPLFFEANAMDHIQAIKYSQRDVAANRCRRQIENLL